MWWLWTLTVMAAAIAVVYVLFIITRLLLSTRQKPNTIAFFHPYCSSHGGGERVLWHAIKSILNHYPQYVIYIYSESSIDEKRILESVAQTFKIDLTSKKRGSRASLPDYSGRIKFVKLKCCHYLEASRYRYLTLLAQNWAAFIVGSEAAYRIVPSIFIESIGFSFTMPIFKLHNCKIATYVHYPMISDDMIRDVQLAVHPSFNNRKIFVDYPMMRIVKLYYYRLLSLCYQHVGKTADVVMVNSNWTREHIERVWCIKARTVYPPCDVKAMQTMSLNRFKDDHKTLNIISISQFRPEKNHLMQLEAFKLFLDGSQAKSSRLTLYGGARNQSDRDRIKFLEGKISSMGLKKNVKIEVGVSFDTLLEAIRRADVAIHTMADEHFGIVLLECMAAGLIVVAHNSGGPKKDIIRHGKNGFLATTANTYAERLKHILKMSKEERFSIRMEARDSSANYSDELFTERLITALSPLFG